MNLSIVVPVFNEPQDNINDLYSRVCTVCSEQKYTYEIIFVDDGSDNGITDFIKSLCVRDNKTKLIRFDKNYGQSKAFLAGFSIAKNDFIVTLDSDLQYLPEEIPFFIARINNGCDVVGGKRPIGSRRLLSKLMTFYFRVFYGICMNDHTCTYSVLSKEIAQKILKSQASMCIRHLAYMFGRNKTEIDVTYQKRECGNTNYPLFKYLVYGLNYLYIFSKALKKEQGGTGAMFNISEQIL